MYIFFFKAKNLKIALSSKFLPKGIGVSSWCNG